MSSASLASPIGSHKVCTGGNINSSIDSCTANKERWFGQRSRGHESESGFLFTGCLSLVQASPARVERSRSLVQAHNSTSSANEDWVCLVTLPDFKVMYRQTRSFESVPRRGMVTGPRRSGDVPVVDHQPPGSTRFVVTRVLQRLRPCS